LVESEYLEMKWSDLEALGWMIKKFDDRTRRYTYQAPACNGFRQTIKSRSELKPGDKKYADILYPKVTRPAPGQMRGGEGPSRQVDGGDGGHEQEEVQEEMEQEQGGEGGGRYQETADPAADPLDIEDVATVVPGMKNHKGDLDIVAAKLKDFVVNKSDVTDFNIKKATEDLETALKKYDHPFSRTIVDHNHNFFEDVINFAMKHSADLLYVVMRLTTTQQAVYGHKTVIRAATLYTQVVTSINPTAYCALNKMLAVVLQGCGLRGPGLELLSTLGITEGSRFVITYALYFFADHNNVNCQVATALQVRAGHPGRAGCHVHGEDEAQPHL
jgi:hypothetical protein